MAEYPPYVFAYNNLKKLFEGIKKASVPPKFNRDFLKTMLGLKSSSYHAMIPFLKRIGFLDQANVPTQYYKDFRDDDLSGKVMKEVILDSYSDIYAANEYAHKLTKEDLKSKIRTITGASKDDNVIPAVVGTFKVMCGLANFDEKVKKGQPKKDVVSEDKNNFGNDDRVIQNNGIPPLTKLGLSYTINLNLPATNDIDVFNAIFKALKENLLK